MGDKKTALKNLEKGKPFKEGFDERRNTKGSKPSIVGKIADKLFNGGEYVTLSNVEEVDDQGAPTGKKLNVRVKFDSADVVVMHYLRRAKKSDRVLIDLIDRIDGKATQQIEAEVKTDAELVVTFLGIDED